MRCGESIFKTAEILQRVQTAHRVPNPQNLANQLSQERYALSSLLEFARTLSPDLGPRGIIRSVLKTVMGKSLIAEAFAYLGIENGGRYELDRKSTRLNSSHLGISY